MVDQLRQSHAEGRLTIEELEERVERAYSARTVGDLAPLVSDLPAPPPPPPPPPTLGQRLRPFVGYGVGLVVLVGAVAGLIFGAMGSSVAGHSHGGFSVSVPFIFIGLLWLRGGRRHWRRRYPG